MATIALAAAGTAFGPAGTFVGGLVGGIIDQYLLFPMLFPKPDVTGPRLDGVQAMSGGEGTPIHWPIGPKVRLPGQVIWLDTREDVENKQKLGGFSGDTATAATWSYFQSLAVSFGRVTPGSALYSSISAVRKVFADTKLLWDNGSVAKYDDITWYLGGNTTPDPLMESKLGAGNVPNYEFDLFCVIERLALDEFGAGRVPNLAALVEQSNDVSVQDALKLLIERAGRDPVADLDVSRLPFCLRGMNLDGPVSTLEAMKLLTGIYGINIQQRDGKIYAFPIGSEDTFVVSADVGTDAEPAITLVKTPLWEAPTSAEVRFSSYVLDGQPGLEPYNDQTRASAAGNKVSMSVPITLRPEEAQAVAKRLVWAGRAERTSTEEFMLPPSMGHVEAGDALLVTIDGREVRVLLTEVTHGSNFQVAAQGRVYQPRAYQQTAIGAETYDGPTGYTPPETLLIIMDMAAPTGELAANPGLFWAVRPDPASASFKGAVLYASMDGADYDDVSSTPATVRTGTVYAFTNRRANQFLWDRSNAITVAMDSGTPVSATEQEVIEGRKNFLAMQAPDGDWEIIGYSTVTAAGTHEDGRVMYALSNLLRGCRGTEALINAHTGSGQRVVLFQAGSSVRFWDFDDASHLGLETYLKAPAVGGLLSAYDARLVTPQGRNAACFAPSALRLLETPAGGSLIDHVFIWANRGKGWTSPIALLANETPDEEHLWSIEIRTGAYLSDLLYSTAVTEPTFNLSSTLRDSIAASNPFSWGSADPYMLRVRKTSNTGVEGRWAELGVSL